MNDRAQRFGVLLSLACLLPSTTAWCREAPLGLFEGRGDIGAVGVPGSVTLEDGLQSYLVTGGGENMWFGEDALHFVWKRMSGDVSLAADIRWIGTGGNAHRKACLLLRQSLDPKSPYADAVVHGDGLTSLQYRQVPGGITREIQANVTAPRRIRIEKQGDFVSLSIAGEGEALHAAGGSFKIRFTEPFFVGLGVCAHDNKVSEKAVFSNVEIISSKARTAGEPVLESTLEIVPIASGDRRAVYHTRGHIEAPNWSRDGKSLLFNRGGRLYRLPVEGGEPQPIDTGFATRLNNDHGLSPDGTQLALSDQSQEGGQSLIYVVPATGGTPRRVTRLGPSYWHGWSPDGKTLAYCAERNGEYDVYTIPVEGGAETRLTTAPGLDDGPEYAPDGRYIYFNSIRAGTMQIWRMKADGSEQQQVTSDEYNNWFPHPSPDGRWIAFLSYEKGVEGHPANKDVLLRLRPTEGGESRVLAELFGGQGTINVPSWSPDSRRIAFVSYRLTGPCTTLDMHPFLYGGEFQKQSIGGNEYFDNQKVYLVRGGKVVWTYLATMASTGGKLVELGDVSMKSDGHIVMSLGWGGAREIIPDYNDPTNSKIVWSCPADNQIHTAQPIGPDQVFVIDNSRNPKAKLYHTKTGELLRTWDLPTVGTDAHSMFRHCRMTKAGTLLIAHMNMAKVVEYDAATMKPIWSVEGMPHCWAAVRLKNGNTMISGNEDKYVREVNPQGRIVWEFSKNDLPAGSTIDLGNIQECDRLANGNTVICTWQGDPSVLEVTPEKKIVWMLPKSALGNSSSIHLLDEPGAMENGEVQR